MVNHTQFGFNQYTPMLNLRSLGHNKLLSNTGIYTIAGMLQKAAAFLLIPFYTRYLSPGDYGVVGIAQSVQNVLSLIIGVGLYSAIARYYYEYKGDKENLRSYVMTNFLFLAFVGAGISIILDRLGGVAWSSFSSGQIPFSPYIRLAVWLALADAIIQVPLTLYRTAQRATPFVIAQLSIFFLSTFIIVFMVIFQKRGVIGVLLGDLIANVIIDLILIGLLFREYGSFRFRLSYLKISLIYGLPLIPHMLARWALVAIDRFLLVNLGVSLDQIGFYNLAYQLGMAMSIFLTSINQAWTPYYFDIMKNEISPELRIRKISLYYITFISALCLIGVLFSPELVKWIIPRSYHGAEMFVPLILCAYLFQGFYYFAISPLLYYKHTSYLSMITLIAVAIGIGINLWGIPKWGIIVAAWATMISYCVSFFLCFIWGRRYQKIDLPYEKIAILVLSVLATSVWITYNPNYYIWFLLILKLGIWIGYTCVAIFWLVLSQPKLQLK